MSVTSPAKLFKARGEFFIDFTVFNRYIRFWVRKKIPRTVMRVSSIFKKRSKHDCLANYRGLLKPHKGDELSRRFLSIFLERMFSEKKDFTKPDQEVVKGIETAMRDWTLTLQDRPSSDRLIASNVSHLAVSWGVVRKFKLKKFYCLSPIIH